MNQRSKKNPQSVIVRGFEFLKASPLKKLTKNVGVNLFFPVNIIFLFQSKVKKFAGKTAQSELVIAELSKQLPVL